MRGFWRILLLGLLLTPSSIFAKFEQTTGTQVDTSKFNGMSQEEIDKAIEAQVSSIFMQEVKRRLEQFDAGDKSSTFDGQEGQNGGRYSGYGEAHITKGDAMISHEGGANGLESAVEKGALGKTGLTGQARVDAEKKIMDEYCRPVDPTDSTKGCMNVATGQLQKSGSKDISAALYDAGPAHGDADDPHRVYAVKPEVRKEVEKNGEKYAALTIRDATLAPGKQPNLDLLHKSFSKMEQDKYVMMATDAFAFRSARLAGIDTSQSINRNVVGEYKQIAIDVYADKEFAGNIDKAEAEIQKRLAARVAEQKVLNNAGGYVLCADGNIKKESDCPANAQGAQASDPRMAAQEILRRLNSSTDGVNVAAIQKVIESEFTKDANGQFQPKSVDDLMRRIKLRDLSGVAARQKLDQLYAQAKQNANPQDVSKIGEYQQRLASNQCFQFTSFCYSSGIGKSLNPNQNANRGLAQNGTGGAAGNNANPAGQSQIDDNEFQKVTGDPGEYFKDTREYVFNRFAYAYNQPLAQFKNNVTNFDFDKNIDRFIKDKGLYAEFNEMYEKAMKEANNIKQNVDQDFINRLKSAGATPEQIAKVQRNYSVNFDPNNLSHMKLFGQNKDRDAIMMEWRKGVTQFTDPKAKGMAAPSSPPPSPFPTTTTRAPAAPQRN